MNTAKTNLFFNPLAIIRTATFAAAANNQAEVIDCIFRAIWSNGQVLEDPERVEDLFKDHDIDPDIVEKSFSREAKLELKANIKQAISANIFGVPSFLVKNDNEDEYFWGNDSFDSLKDYLTGNDNWDKDLYNSLIDG